MRKRRPILAAIAALATTVSVAVATAPQLAAAPAPSGIAATAFGGTTSVKVARARPIDVDTGEAHTPINLERVGCPGAPATTRCYVAKG